MAKKKKDVKSKIAKTAVLFLLHKRIVGREKKKAEQRAAQGKKVRVAAVTPSRILYRVLGGRKTAQMNAQILRKGRQDGTGNTGTAAVSSRKKTGHAGAAVMLALGKAAVRMLDTPAKSKKKK